MAWEEGMKCMNVNISRMRDSISRAKSLPRGKDLPDTDGMPMDDENHGIQARNYLIEPLKRWLTESNIQAFVGGNSFVYYGYNVMTRKPQCLGPDFYVVMGGQTREQSKWVVWEEGGLMPSLVVELVYPSTEARDRGEKFLIYRDILKTQDYFLFNTDTKRLEGFHLQNGVYITASFIRQGAPSVGDSWIRCQGIDLWIGIVDGWLRWYDPKTQRLIDTDHERAVSEKGRADEERRRADQEAQRADEEKRRADEERRRADEAEAELRALREQLAQLRKSSA